MSPPTDFESVASTDSTTPAYILLFTERFFWLYQLAVDSIKFVAVCAPIMVGVMGLEPIHTRYRNLNPTRLPIPTIPPYGAGKGNRTPVSSLEDWSSTIELHLHLVVP